MVTTGAVRLPPAPSAELDENSAKALEPPLPLILAIELSPVPNTPEEEAGTARDEPASELDTGGGGTDEG